MKRTTFDEHRDMQIADQSGKSQALMCSAHGCPNLWSTSIGHLCRWHADADPEQWPVVTRQMQDVETDRARRNAEPAPPRKVWTDAEKVAVLKRLRYVFAVPKDLRAWAYRLKAREEFGEKLNERQRSAWRTALATESTIPEDA